MMGISSALKLLVFVPQIAKIIKMLKQLAIRIKNNCCRKFIFPNLNWNELKLSQREYNEEHQE